MDSGGNPPLHRGNGGASAWAANLGKGVLVAATQGAAMKRKRMMALAVLGLLVALGAGLALPRFLPESSQRFSEPPVGEGQLVSEGTWSGRAGHSASGRVLLYRNESSAWLRFEDFEMTSGPAVFLYLSMASEPDSQAEIESSWRLLIAGGADGGELTKRGDFHQVLPDGFDADRVRGLGAWCADFRVPFGVAPMRAAGGAA